MPLENTGRAIAGAVALLSLVVVKGPTGPGVRWLAFFGGRRGAELGEGNQVLECGAWDGRQPKRGGLDFPWFWDRAGGPWRARALIILVSNRVLKKSLIHIAMTNDDSRLY